mmetsp:Transcript_14102/g.28499  ORF Transcript_14102/g.28499 Transcript_14102/m.28499 type:complete len:103 (-) Transcript_14102:101-409(-)
MCCFIVFVGFPRKKLMFIEQAEKLRDKALRSREGMKHEMMKTGLKEKEAEDIIDDKDLLDEWVQQHMRNKMDEIFSAPDADATGWHSTSSLLADPEDDYDEY